MLEIPQNEDPTLKALDRVIAAEGNAEPPRPRMGASGIGHPCERKLWYQFRWAMERQIEARGIRAIRSGHRGEAEMIEDLRKVPGIELWTRDPEGEQIGFTDLGDHFGGSIDGIIRGLIQAPVTPHVWECKVCNQKKFDELKKLKAKLGEKMALAQWDPIYFAQAQIYMHYMQLDRHYLTVATPGLRDVTSVRTEYDMEAAIRYVLKAARIMFSSAIPFKLSEDPSWYECKFCDFHDICHGTDFAAVNCRTCAHSTALTEKEGGGWRCEKFENVLTVDAQRDGCKAHLYHPHLVPGEPLDATQNEVTYLLRNGETWVDGEK